ASQKSQGSGPVRSDAAVPHSPTGDLTIQNAAMAGVIIDHEDANSLQAVGHDLLRALGVRLFRKADGKPELRAFPRLTSDTNVASIMSRRSISMASKVSLPASILEKSRISLMTVSSASPLLATVVAKLRCSAVSSVSSSRLLIPITPFIGVRIS